MRYSLLFLIFLSSCSGDKSSGKVTIGKILGPSEQEAQRLIHQDLNHLRTTQYAISNDDLALLLQEGLISDEEYRSLMIVQ